ncbi:MAG TPA: hypothetical protein VGB45_08375 [Abditibacterium sp.]|jgi:hypothetical protein
MKTLPPDNLTESVLTEASAPVAVPVQGTLEANPLTGALELVPVAGVEKQRVLRRSYRKSTSQETAKARGMWHSIVLLDGHKVFVLELESAQLDRLKDCEKEFQIETARINREQKQRIITPPQAEEQSFASMEARAAVQYTELRKIIVDWELPDDEIEGAFLPCTDETINDLPFSAVADLAKLILQVSKLGVSESNFLTSSSVDGSKE